MERATKLMSRKYCFACVRFHGFLIFHLPLKLGKFDVANVKLAE